VRATHRVLDVPGRDAESLGKLPQNEVAVLEVGADNHMRVVKLPCDQPAVVPPLSQPLWRGEADTRQGLGQACYVTHLHERGPSCFSDSCDGTPWAADPPSLTAVRTP